MNNEPFPSISYSAENERRIERNRAAVLKKIPYGNYTFSIMLNGDVIATRSGQYAGTFGSAQSAAKHVDSLIQ